ncbi:MAG: S41 family peptidase [Acidobacteria bacterium]|nr:S41 family peptidase [Acidobacteriota bacterium]
MKNRPYIYLSMLLSLAMLFSASVHAQDPVAVKDAKPKTTAVKEEKPAPIKIEMVETDVAEALSIIEDSHFVGKDINYNSVFKSAIDGMLHTLDPHSNYFDAKEFEQFRTEQSSRYFGIGATIGDLSDPDGKMIATYIRATFDGAPAHRAGLRYGDKIVEVNGKDVLGKPYNEVRDLLRGPRGTSAKLVVEKYGTNRRETVEIIRDAVPQPSIAEAYMIKPGVGYIAMTGGFNQTTYDEFRAAMVKLKKNGMTQLILDLKDNGGGLVGHAYRVASTFLEPGQTVFTQKGRIQAIAERYTSENPDPEKMPVVVLVNRNSASASEILAGALQDHDRALIVGETTFGKGLVQNPFVLDYGSMLLLTIAKYETPSGRLIQRDYSNGDLYSYYTKGGVGREDDGEDESQTPAGPESKTDLGRTVYGGGGIEPDVEVKPNMITAERNRARARLNNPIFDFALDLAYGKLPGFENLKADKPIRFEYDISATDFVIDDRVYQAFKKHAVDKYKLSAAQIDAERQYVERSLRAELVTAAYGTTTSYQVFKDYDNQLMKAIELLPRAKQLATEARTKVNNAERSSADNR